MGPRCFFTLLAVCTPMAACTPTPATPPLFMDATVRDIPDTTADVVPGTDLPATGDTTDASDGTEPPRCPGPFAAPDDRERAILHRLGVPDAASCVVILSQSSHMDIDWQQSFDGYYSAFVENILTQAHDRMQADPAYRYSVAEMGFLAEHLRRHPEQAADLRAAAQRGAFRMVGGGITSPDTLLPTTEALVRDFLRGSVLTDTALGVRAHTAWLPDSFGHAPTTPDLLAGMGYTAVGFARVDGMHDFVEAIWRQDAIVAGSTAALLTDMHTTDFVWVGPGGGAVLAHWMPTRLYCQGDTLDHVGTPIAGGWLGDDRSTDRAYSDGQIGMYVTELSSRSRTPYLFVPIGCDFQPPKAQLIPAVAHWNASRYPATGIYAVAATFEDYADLVNERRADLPRMPRDITPYFTGYLGSRLAVKAATRTVGDLLSQTEVTALVARAVAGTPWPTEPMASSWDLLARTNHHDFIAGTAVDDVVTGEQLPMLAGLTTTVQSTLDSALNALATAVPAQPGAAATAAVVGTLGSHGPRVATVSMRVPHGVVRDLAADVPSQVLTSVRDALGMISTATVLVVLPDLQPAGLQRVGFFDRAATGPVSLTESPTDVTVTDSSTRLSIRVDKATGSLQDLTLEGTAWITAPSLDTTVWADQGGLYRLGHETHGCTFTPTGTPGGGVLGAVTVEVLERGPARARLRVHHGTGTTVTLGITAGTRRVDVDVQAAADVAQTVTVGLSTAVTSGTARFAGAGGVTTRPAESLFSPTFWPTVRGMDLTRADGSGLAVLPRVSTGVRWDTRGTVDVMVDRNAVSERCDVLGATGHDQGMPTVSFSLRPHGAPLDLVAEALALLPAPAVQVLSAPGADPSGTVYAMNGTGWVLSAAKLAERGTGVVLRVERTADTGELDLGPGWSQVGTVTRTTLLEDDQAVVGARVPLDAPVVTVRVQLPTR